MKGLNAYTVNRKEPSLRHGGDLEGIRQHLDYFNELGVTALWFTPVLENNSPDHGKTSTYHATPQPTIIVWTRASDQTPTTAVLSTRLTRKVSRWSWT